MRPLSEFGDMMGGEGATQHRRAHGEGGESLREVNEERATPPHQPRSRDTATHAGACKRKWMEGRKDGGKKGRKEERKEGRTVG